MLARRLESAGESEKGGAQKVCILTGSLVLSCESHHNRYSGRQSTRRNPCDGGTQTHCASTDRHCCSNERKERRRWFSGAIVVGRGSQPSISGRLAGEECGSPTGDGSKFAMDTGDALSAIPGEVPRDHRFCGRRAQWEA